MTKGKERVTSMNFQKYIATGFFVVLSALALNLPVDAHIVDRNLQLDLLNSKPLIHKTLAVKLHGSLDAHRLSSDLLNTEISLNAHAHLKSLALGDLIA